MDRLSKKFKKEKELRDIDNRVVIGGVGGVDGGGSGFRGINDDGNKKGTWLYI